VNPRRLYRSSDDRILAGVAGGLAAYLDVDPVIVRIIWFLSVFFTGTLTFWAYLVMIFVVPLEPSEWPPASPWAPGGGPTGGPVGFEAAYAPPAGGRPPTRPPRVLAAPRPLPRLARHRLQIQPHLSPALRRLRRRAVGGATTGARNGARSAGRIAPNDGSSGRSAANCDTDTVARAWCLDCCSSWSAACWS